MSAYTCPFCSKPYERHKSFMKHIEATHPYAKSEASQAALTAAISYGKKYKARHKTPDGQKRYLVKIAEASSGKSAQASSSSFNEVVDLRSPSSSPSPSPPPRPLGHSRKFFVSGNLHGEKSSPPAPRRPAWVTDGLAHETSPSATKDKAAKDKGKGKERHRDSLDQPSKAHGRGKEAHGMDIAMLSDSEEDELDSLSLGLSSVNVRLHQHSKRPPSPTHTGDTSRPRKVLKLGQCTHATVPPRKSERDRHDAVSNLDGQTENAEDSRAPHADSGSDKDTDDESEISEDAISDSLPPAQSDIGLGLTNAGTSSTSSESSSSSTSPSSSSDSDAESGSDDDDDTAPCNSKHDHTKAASVPNSVAANPTAPQRDQFERFMSHALRKQARAEGHPSAAAGSSTAPSASTSSPLAQPTSAAPAAAPAEGHAQSKHGAKWKRHNTSSGAAPTPHASSSPPVRTAGPPPGPPQCDALACASCHAMAHAFHLFHTTHAEWHCDAGP